MSDQAGPRLPAPDVSVLHVVVPAHDEERLVTAAVDGVLAALTEVDRHWGGLVATRLTVVLDRCTDETAPLLARRPDAARVDLLPVAAGSPGAARRLGCDRAAERARGVDPARVWLLHTDADTVVPPDWALDHLSLARGHDLVVGAVRPDPQGLSASVGHAWAHRHQDPAAHVHGANLGVRLTAYRAVGGFGVGPEHEDVDLVRAVLAGGGSVARGTVVTTSARRRGRVAGGFSGYLRDLEADVRAVRPPSHAPEAPTSRPAGTSTMKCHPR